MKYVFEKYEFSKRGRIFKGFETIQASSVEEARETVQNKVGSEIVLAQIYVPQESQ